MPLARADLESLLQARKLDVTLMPAVAPLRQANELVAPGDLPALDARLGGGLPRGQLSQLVGPPSSGRTSLLCAFLAAATARGEIVACVDAADTFDPPSAAAAGLDLTRLLWVRGTPCPAARSIPLPAERALMARALDRALKATDLVLRAGGFGLVALDLAEAPERLVRGLPFTTWLRLQRAIEGSQTVCVLLAAQPIARGPAGVTLALDEAPPRASLFPLPRAAGERVRVRGLWSGTSDRARLFRGLDVRLRVVQARVTKNTKENHEGHEGVRLSLSAPCGCGTRSR